MKKLLSITLLGLSLALPLPVTGAELEANRWNLKDLYPSQSAWDQDVSTLERQFKDLSACAGHLAQSAKRFQQCLDLNADMLKRLYRLSGYASQFHDEDTALPAGQD